MNATLYQNQKINTLRSLETYAYQAAYYLLRDEELALVAAKSALLSLSRDERFYGESQTVQRDMMKKSVIKCSLNILSKGP